MVSSALVPVLASFFFRINQTYVNRHLWKWVWHTVYISSVFSMGWASVLTCRQRFRNDRIQDGQNTYAHRWIRLFSIESIKILQCLQSTHYRTILLHDRIVCKNIFWNELLKYFNVYDYILFRSHTWFRLARAVISMWWNYPYQLLHLSVPFHAFWGPFLGIAIERTWPYF